MMRLWAESGDFVELAWDETATYDVRVMVSVRRADYAGASTAWVSADAWHAFAQQLGSLEECRRGEAFVESISPGEMKLIVRSVDRAGHLGVEGQIGTRTFDTEVSLSFSVFAFEPSQLAAFVRSVREVSAAVAKHQNRGFRPSD